MLYELTTQLHLKNVGETISDELLIAMIFGRLPKEYKPFTAVILNNEPKFINFHNDFDSSCHIIEQADSCKYNNLALKKDACFKMTDTNGKVQRNILNVLYIPSFHKNIFSVQAATENGANIELKFNSLILNAKGKKILNP